jgi:signal transduction histidine kinase
MHDVVAHALAVIIAQADGGRYAVKDSPQASEQVLATIADTGRRALGEMRQLLGVLRQDPDEQHPDPPEHGSTPGHVMAPMPGIANIEALVTSVEAGGLPVTLAVEGTPRPVPEGVGLAAYRTVQEGLTNVLKHAGPAAQATVRLHWMPDGIEVSVVDDGRGAGATPAPAPGQGLIGMRERAAIYGGRVESGPVPGGWYALRVFLSDRHAPVAL